MRGKKETFLLNAGQKKRWMQINKKWHMRVALFFLKKEGE